MTGEQSSEALVDIGIPTHGRPRYLRETIESVMAQTYGRWRMTISENGPGNDEISAIVEPYLSDSRVHHAPTGREISAQENATRAISVGDAPFVALLNDDDRWDAEFLARRVAFLDLNQSCGLVFSHCKFIDDAGVVVFSLRAPLHEGLQQRSTFLRTVYRHNIIAMPTVLCRRSAYDLVGSDFNPSLLFDDYEMWVRIATRHEVGFLDVFDASYRIHSAQGTRPQRVHLGDHRLQLLDAIDRWLPPDFPSLERRRAHSGAHLRASYDAFGCRDRHSGTAHFIQAFRDYPVVLLDPRMAALAIGSLRYQAKQRRLWNEAPSTDESRS